jgi:hypothetical protein
VHTLPQQDEDFIARLHHAITTIPAKRRGDQPEQPFRASVEEMIAFDRWWWSESGGHTAFRDMVGSGYCVGPELRIDVEAVTGAANVLVTTKCIKVFAKLDPRGAALFGLAAGEHDTRHAHGVSIPLSPAKQEVWVDVGVIAARWRSRTWERYRDALDNAAAEVRASYGLEVMPTGSFMWAVRTLLRAFDAAAVGQLIPMQWHAKIMQGRRQHVLMVRRHPARRLTVGSSPIHHAGCLGATEAGSDVGITQYIGVSIAGIDPGQGQRSSSVASAEYPVKVSAWTGEVVMSGSTRPALSPMCIWAHGLRRGPGRPGEQAQQGRVDVVLRQDCGTSGQRVLEWKEIAAKPDNAMNRRALKHALARAPFWRRYVGGMTAAAVRACERCMHPAADTKSDTESDNDRD